jgi:hypothetical protein
MFVVYAMNTARIMRLDAFEFASDAERYITRLAVMYPAIDFEIVQAGEVS